ncbi:MAG: MarR family transcriptional regulator [Pontixanthobacter sp.]
MAENNRPTDVPDTLDERVFLGRLLADWAELIDRQSQQIFDHVGITIPVHSCSLMLGIERIGPASASDIAHHLDRSHQLVLQKLPKLLKTGLLTRTDCPDDRRRKLISLTGAGREQLALLRRWLPHIMESYDDLSDEIGDMHGFIENAIAAMVARPLSERTQGIVALDTHPS